MKKIIISLMLAAAILVPTFLPMTDSNVTVQASQVTIGTVNSNNVIVRRGPGTNYDALGQVHKAYHDSFEVVGHEGAWCKIKYNRQGVTFAYIHRDYLNQHSFEAN